VNGEGLLGFLMLSGCGSTGIIVALEGLTLLSILFLMMSVVGAFFIADDWVYGQRYLSSMYKLIFRR